jgi:hypothetical protein
MRRRLLLVALLPLAACGPSRSEVANALAHRCEMERLDAEMAAAPGRTDLRDEYIQRGAFLRDVVETSADPERLREIVAATPCE